MQSTVKKPFFIKMVFKRKNLSLQNSFGTYVNNNLYLNNEKNKTNKNTLETSLCMGYYNIDDNIPIDLSFKGSKNKNNEIRELKNGL